MSHVLFFFVVLILADLTTVQTVLDLIKEDDLPTPVEENEWIWGYADHIGSNRIANVPVTTETATTTNKEAPTAAEGNPCDIPAPTLPDFSGPGRRVSDKKCYEYLWKIWQQENSIVMFNKCAEYKNKKLIEAGKEPIIYGGMGGIGGRDAQPNEFLHMAAIGWPATVGSWIFKCGGSIISSKFVLTAAHCSKASEKDSTVTSVTPKIVRIGDKNILDFNEHGNKRIHTDKNIMRFINHPNYESPKKYFDIAVIEMADEIQFGTIIQPACLYTGADEKLIGRQANMTGWGVVEAVTRVSSPHLQVVELDILGSPVCDELLKSSCNRHWCNMSDSQMCAGKLAGGADACQGDSGGPLQIVIPIPQNPNPSRPYPYMYQVIGVTSFGIGCALPNLPGVYTKVSSFLDWIEHIVFK